HQSRAHRGLQQCGVALFHGDPIPLQVKIIGYRRVEGFARHLFKGALGPRAPRHAHEYGHDDQNQSTCTESLHVFSSLKISRGKARLPEIDLNSRSLSRKAIPAHKTISANLFTTS